MSESSPIVPPSTKRIWTSIAPTAVFLIVNWPFGVVAAAIAATTVAVGVLVLRARHRERVGWVLPITLVYVVGRGAASALTQSEDIYFGIGIGASALVATVVFASAWTDRPVGLFAIPLAARYDTHVRTSTLYLRVARHVTAVWAIAELTVTVWEAWHLREVGPAEFVGRRTLIGWPFMAFVIFWLIFYVRLRLDPLAHRPTDRTSPEAAPSP